jgi:hypothetical protein
LRAGLSISAFPMASVSCISIRPRVRACGQKERPHSSSSCDRLASNVPAEAQVKPLGFLGFSKSRPESHLADPVRGTTVKVGKPDT